MKNFALIGVAGYIAERHVRAIFATGNRLIAVLDPHDSVGFLDKYDFNIKYFAEPERFDRYLEKLRIENHRDKVDFVSICSPNYLHDAHCRMALRLGANAICEKPLVINPWNLDPLIELENETGKKINTVLQLRLHSELIKLQKMERKSTDFKDVVLTYITSRGDWYYSSWKGSTEKSGGILTNIGIHFFDLLIWMFGSVQQAKLHSLSTERAAGLLILEKARVRWFLSTDPSDLPFAAQPGAKTTYRAISFDDQLIDFSDGLNEMHTKVYEDILSGGGFGIDDARPSILLTSQLRNCEVSTDRDDAHPFLKMD